MFKIKPREVDISLANTGVVAVFNKAVPPLVWRFDLERNHSFSLALRNDNNQWVLGYTPVGSDFVPIASFATEANASHAFTALQKGLTGYKKNFFGRQTKLYLLAALVFCIAGVVANHYYLQYTSHTRLARSIDPNIPLGVSLSADSMLKAPTLSPQYTPQHLELLPNSNAKIQPQVDGVPLSADQFLKAPNSSSYQAGPPTTGNFVDPLPPDSSNKP